MALDNFEVMLFDTSQRDVGSTLSDPTWTLNSRTFIKDSRIRVTVTIPPIPPVYSNATAHNNVFSFTIGVTTYTVTIAVGFYENANEVVEAFNDALAAHADPVANDMELSLDTHTAKVTATHGASDFTIAETSPMLGFVVGAGSADSAPALSLTATTVCQVGENSIFVCSNMEALLYHHSAASTRESYIPSEIFLASTLPVVSSYYHARSEWINIVNTTNVASVEFYFVNPSDPTTTVTVSHPWSVLIEFGKGS